MRVPPLDGVTPAGTGTFEPLPSGWYNVRVEDAEPVVASTGTSGIKIQMKVLDGPHEGRVIFDRMWLSAGAAPFILQTLQAMQYPIPAGEFDLEPMELIGRRCAVSVDIRTYTKNNGEQGVGNEVKAYDKIAGAELPITPAEPQAEPDSDVPF